MGRPRNVARGTAARRAPAFDPLYNPFGVAGIVLGTVIGTVAMTVAQGIRLRPDLGGVEGRETLSAVMYMLVAAALLGILSWATWSVVDDVLGRTLIAQAISVGTAIAVGLSAYAAAVWGMGLQEARQIQEFLTRRNLPRQH